MFFCIFFSLESSYRHKKKPPTLSRQRPFSCFRFQTSALSLLTSFLNLAVSGEVIEDIHEVGSSGFLLLGYIQLTFTVTWAGNIYDGSFLS